MTDTLTTTEEQKNVVTNVVVEGVLNEDEEQKTEGSQLTDNTLKPKKKVLSTAGTSRSFDRNSREISDKIVFIDNIIVEKEEFVNIVREYAIKGNIVDIRFLCRNKGGAFAFVEFESEEDGKNAIQQLDQKEFISKAGKVVFLRASTAQNPTETTSRKNLYIKNVPKKWTHEDLRTRFKGFGTITHCRVLKKNDEDVENTGCGFVHFSRWEDSQKALDSLNGQPVDPENKSLGNLDVNFARMKKNTRSRRKPQGRRPMPNAGKRRGTGRDGSYKLQRRNVGGRNNYYRGNQYQKNKGGNQGQYPNWMSYPPTEEVWENMMLHFQQMSIAMMYAQNPNYYYGNQFQHTDQQFQNPSKTVGDSMMNDQQKDKEDSENGDKFYQQ